MSYSETTKIVPVDIIDEMKRAYIDYSMSVIVGRALPDVRDGLKPVHRRILYAMNDMGLRSDAPMRKSATVVGQVLGKYHPHGDLAVYEAMVRLAQDWSMRVPLVQGQGNFGSQDGDGPAAHRYTEARLTKVAEAMLQDINKDTVDFVDNYDGSTEEPTVLPSRVPQLLVNGVSGIAVGMATNLLPHNLSEIIDGCLAYIKKREITIEELMHYIKAPDFPTGGTIYGVEGVKKAMATGRGRVIVRGKVVVEEEGNHTVIIIKELPYQVSGSLLLKKIHELKEDKKIEGISNVSNQSSEAGGTRLIIELKKDAIPNVVVNQLYKFTELEKSFSANNVVLKGGRPKLLNLKELIASFIDFRHEVVVRRTQYELREAQKRAHILEGYLKALDHLDEVISTIRESKDNDIAKQSLIARFAFSEIQTQAILEMRLGRLSGLERKKIKDEYAEVSQTIARCEAILSSEPMRYDIISQELKEVKEKYGTERKSEIEYAVGKFDITDVIPNEPVVITISHNGYIKRTEAAEYRQQKRGGRGSKGSQVGDNDWVEHLFITETHNTMLFFTEKGRCYWKKVYEIPESSKTSKGRAIQNFLQIESDDNVRTILDIPKFNDSQFLDEHSIIFCTKKGIVKRSPLRDFSRPMQKGIRAIQIVAGDTLLDARLTDNQSEVMMAVKSGKAVRFKEEAIRSSGRGAIGVRGMKLDTEKDEVIGLLVLTAQEQAETTILALSDLGYGKRTRVEDYRRTHRGSRGVKTLTITPKTGDLVGFLAVRENEDLMITCKSGLTIRTALSEIRTLSRGAQGVKLINLSPKDQIAAIASIEREAEIETAETDSEISH